MDFYEEQDQKLLKEEKDWQWIVSQTFSKTPIDLNDLCRMYMNSTNKRTVTFFSICLRHCKLFVKQRKEFPVVDLKYKKVYEEAKGVLNQSFMCSIAFKNFRDKDELYNMIKRNLMYCIDYNDEQMYNDNMFVLKAVGLYKDFKGFDFIKKIK